LQVTSQFTAIWSITKITAWWEWCVFFTTPLRGQEAEDSIDDAIWRPICRTHLLPVLTGTIARNPKSTAN